MKTIDRASVNRILQWEGGQRLFNFAYSVGAAIVILGALFKILHLPGGNTLLMVGMGTEVLMFLITAFDRPPKEYNWEEVFPALKGEESTEEEEQSEEETAVSGGGGTVIIAGGVPTQSGAPVVIEGNAGGAITPAGTIVGGGMPAPGAILNDGDAASLSDAIQRMSAATAQLEQFADMAAATRDYMTRLASVSDQLNRLNDTTRALNSVSEVLLDSYRAITENSESITRSSSGYVREMETLNRNVNGLNTIYEIQLKSVSSQLDAIDRVNQGIKDIRDMYEKSSSQSQRYAEETEKMAHHMQQLNHIYENMLHAMTVNMMPGMAAPKQ